MKKCFLIAFAIFAPGLFLFAQPEKTNYPEPEFSNEVYYLKKDKDYSLVRLEKSSSKMDNKTKIIGGSSNSYNIEGEKSPIRFTSGNSFSFVFSKGTSPGSSSPRSDSMMKANGMDPNMMEDMGGGMDPSSALTLYKTSSEKNNRKIYLMKVGGYFSTGKNKMQTSDKITFSIKKIRNGYWELVIDKPLPKGEYAFTMMNMGMSGMDGSTLIFAFGVD